jgi:hypothetical protein
VRGVGHMPRRTRSALLLGPTAGITAVLLAALALRHPQHQTHPSRTRVIVAIALGTVGMLMSITFWASQANSGCGCPSEPIRAASTLSVLPGVPSRG